MKWNQALSLRDEIILTLDRQLKPSTSKLYSLKLSSQALRLLNAMFVINAIIIIKLHLSTLKQDETGW